MTRTLLCALALLFVAESATAAAGKVLLASGSVALERDGGRALQAGDPLNVDDVVVTGEQSRVQILMADGARIALRANSRLRIDELSLPSSVQQPGAPVASFGKSAGTLLEGGLSAHTGVIGYEMQTPIGTLGVRKANYTAVFCGDGECGDAPGLYLTVDEGAITFSGRGLSLALSAPAVEFIPAEAGEPQQLVDVPTFLRNDGAGPLEAAGRPVRIAAATVSNEVLGNEAFGPTPVGSVPDRPILASTALGRSVDLLVPEATATPRASVAVAVPPSGQTSLTAAATGPFNSDVWSASGGLLQFDAANTTYRAGTAALLGAGSNGASRIRWGRWSTGAASAGAQTLNLTNTSLHWIIGPSFELAPLLPTSGSTNFVLAGGTDPTDTSGNVGRLNRAVLTANFTTQQVSTKLSLDIDGLNWFASGSGPITAGTVRFRGAFSDVLIDGRVRGSGDFNGFFSAGPTTPDQLNGAGLAYQLRDTLNQLGTVSGVAAFVPGTGPTPVATTVSRDVAYAIGNVGTFRQAAGSASERTAQLTTDVAGNLAAFAAPLAGAKNTVFRLNMGAITDAGFDVATGIRWGRWEGSNLYVTSPGSATVKSDLAGESLHWLVSSEYGAAPTIPRTGTAEYALIGHTDPTDTLGNIGAFGSASFSADFVNLTVHSAVAVTMGDHNWFARGTGSFDANGTLFNGTYDTVSIDNLIAGAGNFSGFFTVPRIGAGSVAGAGVTYNIVGDPADLGTVSGALVFQQGAGNESTSPPLAPRDVAYVVPSSGFDNARVARMPETGYAIDETFSLTQLLVRNQSGELETLQKGTSTLIESAPSGIVMMRWGRWSAGALTSAVVSTGATSTLALGPSSVHWIESADSETAPLIPTTGTASYQLIGATTPSDRHGNLGTLNSATFNADFTAQLVNASVDLTINGESWTASGLGAIGSPTGLQSNHFGGSFTSGAVGASGAPAHGSFAGFFTNPVGVSGVPIGAGFTYTVTDPIGGNNVDGAAVFRKP